MGGTTTTGYYGKLPFAREFLKLNSAGVEISELDSWLQEGMLYAKSLIGEQWPEMLQQAPISNFLFVAPRRDRVVLGVIVPSQDEVGREFPFLLYLLINKDSFLSPVWLFPLLCREFLNEARLLVAALRANLDWKVFQGAVSSLLGPSRDEAMHIRSQYDQTVRHTTAGEFLTNVFKDNGGRLPERNRSVFEDDEAPRLNEAVAPDPTAIGLPLLIGAITESYDVPFWLHMCSKWRGASGEPTIALWNRHISTSEPRMIVGFKQASPKVVQYLFDPTAREKWGNSLISPLASSSNCVQMRQCPDVLLSDLIA